MKGIQIKKGGYLVSWKYACHSKEDGGLGIIKLRHHNSALLLKFLHKFYNKVDLPWVRLTWQYIYSNGKPPMKECMLVHSGGEISCPLLLVSS
jgi:hypothetical protein